MAASWLHLCVDGAPQRLRQRIELHAAYRQGLHPFHVSGSSQRDCGNGNSIGFCFCRCSERVRGLGHGHSFRFAYRIDVTTSESVFDRRWRKSVICFLHSCFLCSWHICGSSDSRQRLDFPHGPDCTDGQSCDNHRGRWRLVCPANCHFDRDRSCGLIESLGRRHNRSEPQWRRLCKP